MYLFLAVRGLCCVAFSLVAASRGYSLVVVCRLLNAMASFMADRAQAVGRTGFSSPSSQALEHRLGSCDAWA